LSYLLHAIFEFISNKNQRFFQILFLRGTYPNFICFNLRIQSPHHPISPSINKWRVKALGQLMVAREPAALVGCLDNPQFCGSDEQ
jgi:hypothetical protein